MVPQNRLVDAWGVRLLLGGPEFPAIEDDMGVALKGATNFDVPLGPQNLRVDSHECCPRAVASFVVLFGSC
jgi:hypothetical protein